MKNTNAPVKVTFDKYGEPKEVLNIEPLAIVKPGAGEVAVRLLASPVDPVDALIIMGKFAPFPQLPAIPGVEGLGEVYAVGDSVDKSLIGKRVRMPQRSGAWIESVIAKVNELMFVPSEIEVSMASMAFVNPPTAWCMMFDYIELKPGDWIVQNAANSAVGVCVIQMAKHFGFKTLNLVRDLDTWKQPLTQMGADVVLKEGSEWYKDPKYQSIAKLALNPIGGETIIELMKALRPNGVHVSYATLANEPITFPIDDLMSRNISMRGFILFYRANNSSKEEMQKIMESIFDLMKKGVIEIAVEKTYPLQDVKKAIAEEEGFHRKGKILLVSNWSPDIE